MVTPLGKHHVSHFSTLPMIWLSKGIAERQHSDRRIPISGRPITRAISARFLHHAARRNSTLAAVTTPPVTTLTAKPVRPSRLFRPHHRSCSTGRHRRPKPEATRFRFLQVLHMKSVTMRRRPTPRTSLSVRVANSRSGFEPREPPKQKKVDIRVLLWYISCDRIVHNRLAGL